ncbi:glutaredoxin-like protein, YruB-family [Calidithermus terrae]|uniref:Glutaredoxin-like protein, YruB-family n=1 Tax=Calidithermus terrae TaxID=1408545 RepID=A0A399F3D7_9DEIN|nr:glutaredoxin family protein [Calidithermus terrae]RIH90550.1 glutaredoxin-like protein, YruB-family [Calidithermus terrae]
MVKVYGLTGCGPCEVAKLFLAQKGVEFEFVDVGENAAGLRKVRELVGGLSAGVVLEVDGKSEAILGVSIPRLERWYREHVGPGAG